MMKSGFLKKFYERLKLYWCFLDFSSELQGEGEVLIQQFIDSTSLKNYTHYKNH